MATHNTAGPQQDRCHLLRIPPELRLSIYEYYFGKVKTCSMTWDTAVCVQWRSNEANNNGSQILSLCKEVYNEACPVLLAACRLYVDPSGLESVGLHRPPSSTRRPAVSFRGRFLGSGAES